MPEQDAQTRTRDSGNQERIGNTEKWDKPNKSVVSKALKTIQDIAVKTVTSTAEKAIQGNLPVILEQLKRFIQLTTG